MFADPILFHMKWQVLVMSTEDHSYEDSGVGTGQTIRWPPSVAEIFEVTDAERQ